MLRKICQQINDAGVIDSGVDRKLDPFAGLGVSSDGLVQATDLVSEGVRHQGETTVIRGVATEKRFVPLTNGLSERVLKTNIRIFPCGENTKHPGSWPKDNTNC